MKSLLFATIICSTFAFSAFAGNGGRGGIPASIDIKGFTDYVLGYGLETSLQSYYSGLSENLEHVVAPSDPGVAAIFRSMMAKGLAHDVAAHNFDVGLERCMKPGDQYNPELKSQNKPRAWTQTGENGIWNIGGKICFDIDGLVEDYKDLTTEEAAARFTALAFHEITHHFQNASADLAVIEQEEAEANTVGGYVRLHKKVGLQPIVEWASNNYETVESGSSTHSDNSNSLFVFDDKSLRFPGINAHIFRAAPFAWEGTFSGRKYTNMIKNASQTAGDCRELVQEAEAGVTKEGTQVCLEGTNYSFYKKFEDIGTLNNMINAYGDRISGGGMTADAEMITGCFDELVPAFAQACQNVGIKFDCAASIHSQKYGLNVAFYLCNAPVRTTPLENTRR